MRARQSIITDRSATLPGNHERRRFGSSLTPQSSRLPPPGMRACVLLVAIPAGIPCPSKLRSNGGCPTTAISGHRRAALRKAGRATPAHNACRVLPRRPVGPDAARTTRYGLARGLRWGSQWLDAASSVLRGFDRVVTLLTEGRLDPLMPLGVDGHPLHGPLLKLAQRINRMQSQLAALTSETSRCGNGSGCWTATCRSSACQTRAPNCELRSTGASVPRRRRRDRPGAALPRRLCCSSGADSLRG